MSASRLAPLDRLIAVVIAMAFAGLTWLIWRGALAPFIGFVVGWLLITTLLGMGRLAKREREPD